MSVGCFLYFCSTDPDAEPEGGSKGTGPCPHTTVRAEVTFGLTVRCMSFLLIDYGKQDEEPWSVDGCDCSVGREMASSLTCGK